ncbi:MAG: hypothetical protein V1806_00260 [Pseudomonadota bacterium]
MPVFQNSQQMLDMLKDLWTHVVFESPFGAKLREYEITYKFVISDPAGYLWVGPEQVLIGEEANLDAVITMELSGDTVHAFWLKKLQLPVALATRKIKSKGPIPKVLKILPFLKPVYEKYPEYCAKHGIAVN